MKCPNCSAECSDQALECDFCGHPIVDVVEQAVPPAAPVLSPAPPPLEMVSEPTPVANPYASMPQAAARSAAEVPNHLIWAIVATVVAALTNFVACCCLPIGLISGITAIVYALRVNKFLETGEINSAEQAARNAKIWAWVTTVLAVIFTLWVIATFVFQISDPAFFENIRKQVEASR
jgi:hypothetical protein